jgi:hypothetical protein
LEAQELINAKPPGFYTLSELYDDVWGRIWRPRAYGKGFYEAVCKRLLVGIAWVKKRSDRCHLYEVLPRAA